MTNQNIRVEMLKAIHTLQDFITIKPEDEELRPREIDVFSAQLREMIERGKIVVRASSENLGLGLDFAAKEELSSEFKPIPWNSVLGFLLGEIFDSSGEAINGFQWVVEAPMKTGGWDWNKYQLTIIDNSDQSQ
jgi:hypothetical protein